MKKMISFVVIGLALSACDGNKNTIELVCGENDVSINMSDNGDTLNTVINGSEMVFNIAISASGARYISETETGIVTLWNKGEDWTLFFDDNMPITCSIK